jgi:hypothetical protein
MADHPATFDDDAAAAAAAGLAWIQGLYYVATGMWPLVHMRSFERVTGPKTDRWLVRTLGALIAVVGVSLCREALRADARGAALLGGLSAAALGAVDVHYVARRRIAPVYLADALPEAALAAGWLAVARFRQDAARGLEHSAPAQER